MSKTIKPVRFDLLQPCYLQRGQDGVSRENIYDLSTLLQQIAMLSPAQTQKKVLGDIYVVQVCNYISELMIWEMQLLRLREKILPGIADDDGHYDLIQLGENQYPAESTTILYDPRRSTLCMQRNVFAVSIRALEEYLQLLSPEGTLVCLKPVLVGKRINSITPDKLYRKIILVADGQSLADDENHSLGEILRSFGKYQGPVVKVEIGFGRQKKGHLNAHNITELVREAYHYNGTTNLKVRLAENEDCAVETIDLLEDRDSFFVRIDYSRSTPITHERLFRMCLGEYKERKGLE